MLEQKSAHFTVFSHLDQEKYLYVASAPYSSLDPTYQWESKLYLESLGNHCICGHGRTAFAAIRSAFANHRALQNRSAG